MMRQMSNKNHPTESCCADDEDVIPREGKYSLDDPVENELSTMTEELQENILRILFQNVNRRIRSVTHSVVHVMWHLLRIHDIRRILDAHRAKSDFSHVHDACFNIYRMQNKFFHKAELYYTAIETKDLIDTVKTYNALDGSPTTYSRLWKRRF